METSHLGFERRSLLKGWCVAVREKQSKIERKADCSSVPEACCTELARVLKKRYDSGVSKYESRSKINGTPLHLRGVLDFHFLFVFFSFFLSFLERIHRRIKIPGTCRNMKLATSRPLYDRFQIAGVKSDFVILYYSRIRRLKEPRRQASCGHSNWGCCTRDHMWPRQAQMPRARYTSFKIYNSTVQSGCK